MIRKSVMFAIALVAIALIATSCDKPIHEAAMPAMQPR